MKKLLNCVGLLVAVLMMNTVEGVLQTSPVLAWSNSLVFEGKNVQILEAKRADEVNIWTGRKDSIELVVLYIEPQMKTEEFTRIAGAWTDLSQGGAFTHLKNLFQFQSSSSVAFPYVVSDSIANTLISTLLESAPARSEVVVVGTGSQLSALRGKNVRQIASFEALKEVMNPEWSLLHNGVSDLLIINLEVPQEKSMEEIYSSHDNIFEVVDKAIKEAGYIAVFTSSEPVPDVKRAFPVSHPLMARFEERQVQEQLGADDTFWPDHVVEGLIVMVPFIVILFVGVCCLFGVQSALKFDAEKATRRNQ